MSQLHLTSKELSDAFQNYSNVIQLNEMNQQGKKKIENTTESILLRLDEYGEHLDNVKKKKKNFNLKGTTKYKS